MNRPRSGNDTDPRGDTWEDIAAAQRIREHTFDGSGVDTQAVEATHPAEEGITKKEND